MKNNKIRIDAKEKELGACWLNDFNISIINCGGKQEFCKYVDILNRVKIPWIIIADFDFIREGLSEFFTKLGYDRMLSDKLNAIKSKISISGKYDSLSQITNKTIKDVVTQFMEKLSKEEQIYILTGKLEHFYKEKPKFEKESGVIETLSKQMEDKKLINNYIIVDEFEIALKIFLED